MSVSDKCVLQTYLTIILVSYAVTANASDTEEMPSAEFLEFIGELQSTEGQWIDPLMLMDSEIGNDENDPKEPLYNQEEQSNG